MTYPQHIAAPDGTPLVIIPKAEHDRLLAAARRAEKAKRNDRAREDDAVSELEQWSPLFGGFRG